MFVSKKRFNALVEEVNALKGANSDNIVWVNGRLDNVWERLHDIDRRTENNRKSVSRANSRVTAAKQNLRKTFAFLALNADADKCSNTEIAKWLEENL